MKAFLRQISPRRAILDFWQVLGAPSEYRAIALVLAALVTGGIFVVMSNQGGRGLPRPPVVTYFPSLIEGRSDAEILAENRIASDKARAEEAEQEAGAERVRQMYKAVGNATGVETEKAYRDGVRERAEAIAKRDAARKAVLDKHLVDNPVFDAEQRKQQAQEQSAAQ